MNVKIETVKTWISESVILTAEPHSNYDSSRVEKMVEDAFRNARNYDGTFAKDVDDLKVECIDLDYDDDDTERFRLIVSYTTKPKSSDNYFCLK